MLLLFTSCHSQPAVCRRDSQVPTWHHHLDVPQKSQRRTNKIWAPELSLMGKLHLPLSIAQVQPSWIPFSCSHMSRNISCTFTVHAEHLHILPPPPRSPRSTPHYLVPQLFSLPLPSWPLSVNSTHPQKESLQNQVISCHSFDQNLRWFQRTSWKHYSWALTPTISLGKQEDGE